MQPCPWSTVNVLPPIVSVADRAAPEVGAAANCTSPLPVPLAPDVIVSHGALLVAVQAQPGPVAIATEPEPPDAGTLWRSADSVYSQPCAWVTVTVRPATLNVPVRAAPSAAATENVTSAGPTPLETPWIVIHGAWLSAVQEQAAAVVTRTLLVPPVAARLRASGSTVYEQPGDWVTVTS